MLLFLRFNLMAREERIVTVSNGLCLCVQVTSHALAGIEKVVGHYGHNRLKVSDLFALFVIDQRT